MPLVAITRRSSKKRYLTTCFDFLRKIRAYLGIGHEMWVESECSQFYLKRIRKAIVYKFRNRSNSIVNQPKKGLFKRKVGNQETFLKSWTIFSSTNVFHGERRSQVQKKKKKKSLKGRGRARGGARQTGWSVRHPGAPQGGRCSHAVVPMRTERTRSR